MLPHKKGEGGGSHVDGYAGGDGCLRRVRGGGGRACSPEGEAARLRVRLRALRPGAGGLRVAKSAAVSDTGEEKSLHRQSLQSISFFDMLKTLESVSNMVNEGERSPGTPRFPE